MAHRPISVVPATALEKSLAAIRREAGVPEAFPADVLEEAEAAARPVEGERERMDIPFITIDPPGARDLDQALHIERRGSGHRVHYAIADVAAFVAPGGAIDREAHARGATVYAPDGKAPLHPPVLSEGAASLLPGEWRPAILWTLDLEARGELVATDVRRALVRSVAQHTYDDVDDPLLREVGERRLALERERGGVRLAVPEQEVVRDGDGWTIRYRAPVASEEHNAQISLLTGMAAAELMLRAGVGILRTQPPPDERALARLRRAAAALGVPWPAGTPYAEFIRGLDPAKADHAAVLHEASTVGRGASYTPFDGDPPENATHFAVAAPYAHATAPLRRLQDRFVSECCLGDPPDWVRAGLAELPAAMAAGARRANSVERAVVDLVEAVLLAGREGERFDAVVIDDGLVQLRHPAVRAHVQGSPEVGSEVTVRLERADPASRKVAFVTAP
ncbi:MAG TPA: RNB domain-containing ribonuclease [Solirubrobacter sp.]|nr:RNB domain-containing ribonuclease [Solirubrobacter sp.]